MCRGTFRIERTDGSHFDVRIPPFSLESNKDDKAPPAGYTFWGNAAAGACPSAQSNSQAILRNGSTLPLLLLPHWYFKKLIYLSTLKWDVQWKGTKIGLPTFVANENFCFLVGRTSVRSQRLLLEIVLHRQNGTVSTDGICIYYYEWEWIIPMVSLSHNRLTQR